MVADVGAVDHIIAFETTEALRNLSYLKPGGNLFSSDESIIPLPVLTGKSVYASKSKKSSLSKQELL